MTKQTESPVPPAEDRVERARRYLVTNYPLLLTGDIRQEQTVEALDAFASQELRVAEQKIAELEAEPFRRATEESGNCCGDAHMELEWMHRVMDSLGLTETRTKKEVFTEIVWTNTRAEAAERERDEARKDLERTKGSIAYLKQQTVEARSKAFRECAEIARKFKDRWVHGSETIAAAIEHEGGSK